MASELKVDKFTGVTTAGSIDVTGEGNSTTTNLQQGLCKAWADVSQAQLHSLDDSFNRLTVTDNGTGDTSLTCVIKCYGNGAYQFHLQVIKRNI